MTTQSGAITGFHRLSWYQEQTKKVLISVLKRLPHGSVKLYESGELLGHYGDTQSSLNAEIRVLEPEFYPKFLLGGSIAAGETYIEKLWNTPNLTKVIQIFARNLPLLDEIEKKLSWITSPFNQWQHWRNRNSKSQAKQNIGAHYDLGNELYTRFLDESMMYSSAIYPHQDASLAEAQSHKLKTICEKLNLQPGDHLLEIGTGWGGLAVFAAAHYGCQVTTTTISEEQHAWTQALIEKRGLQDKITLLKQDYRELQGQFDKLVSIEMIEAVGKSYLPGFFRQCASLLKPDGIMLLQSITISDQRYDSYSQGVDFIQKHIFPGGFLPSLLVLNQQVKAHTSMAVRDTQDIGLDYAQTLAHWRENLLAKKTELNQLGYDERFFRLWLFYFAYCEGGFKERSISTVQLVITKPAHLDEIKRG